jgi:glutamyl/glutaminyl-tRNA synthetase
MNGNTLESGAIFDEEKLKWFNRQYISKLTDEDFTERAGAFVPEWVVPKSDVFKKLIPLLREKISTFGELTTMLSKNGELGFVHQLSEYATDSLLWKKNPDPAAAAAHLAQVSQSINKLDAAFTADTFKSSIWPSREE